MATLTERQMAMAERQRAVAERQRIKRGLLEDYAHVLCCHFVSSDPFSKFLCSLERAAQGAFNEPNNIKSG